MSKNDSEPKRRNKAVVVIVKPHYSPDPNGNNYEQYCQQKLMLHKPFRDESELKDNYSSFTEAYAHYLHSGNVPPCLQDDIHRLQQQANDNEQQTEDEAIANHPRTRQIEEWMILCEQHNQLEVHDVGHNSQVDWAEAARAYPNLAEAPTFIIRSKESAILTSGIFTDPQLLQGTQLEAYQIVVEHFTHHKDNPLRMIITGTAGTGKSFLIACLKQLLSNKVKITAPTGVAAFNVQGCTLHSLLQLPTKGEFKDLQGESLIKLQQSLKEVAYIIIDEMSMVGRKLMGQIDRRLRQAFPNYANQILGGRSCLLFGDFGQLPPVFDLPLFTTTQSSNLSDLGRTAYQSFDKAVVLTRVMRQTGLDPQQVRF